MKHLTFKQKVVQGIHDLFYIWVREFRTTFRDQACSSSLCLSRWYIR